MLQVEEQVTEPQPNFQPVRQANQSIQAPFRQSRQHKSVGQVRSNSNSGNNQAEM